MKKISHRGHRGHRVFCFYPVISVISVAKNQEVNMDEKCSSIKGIYRDILKDRDNNIIFDSGWNSNVIVDQYRAILALLMKNHEINKINGIKYLKVGKGDPDWDNTGAPPPGTSVTQLEDPDPFVVTKLVFDYLNEQDEEMPEEDGPTNRLQITATLGIDEPKPTGQNLKTYPLREFGLFGEYEDSKGKHEYMIDCIRHPRIDKDINTTLVRIVRLYF